MSHETFADGIGRIAIIDGIVRVDLVSYSPTEHGPDGKPRQVFSHRVVMGQEQFLQAADKILRAADMIRQGGMQPAQAAPQPVPQAPRSPQQAAPQPAGPRPPQVAPEHRRESIKPEPPAPPTRPFP